MVNAVVQGEPVDLGKFGDFLAASYIPNRAVVDCTASDDPPQHYISWMTQVRSRHVGCTHQRCLLYP